MLLMAFAPSALPFAVVASTLNDINKRLRPNDINKATQAELGSLKSSTETSLAALKSSTEADIAALKSSTDANIAALKSSTEADIAALKSSTDADIAALKSSTDAKIEASNRILAGYINILDRMTKDATRNVAADDGASEQAAMPRRSCASARRSSVHILALEE